MGQETEETLLGGAAEEAAAEGSLLAGDAAKAEDAKPDEEKAAEAKSEDKSEVPEQYEYSFENAEAVDGTLVETFSELARENNLSNEAANKMLGTLAQKVSQRQWEQVAAVKQEWADSAQSDKEFGGEAFAENLAVAKRAMDSFASPALVQYMNESGLGNHPEMIRLFYKVGKSISEDAFVNGKEPVTARTAQDIYNQSNMNP